MTGIELVREYFPDASDQEADSILWACTAFPFVGGEDGGIAHYRKQLQHIKDRSGGDIELAMIINDEEISDEMGAIKKEAT